MTTNAIDRKSLIIASDSRWSFNLGDEIFYVDDTGFDKMASRAVGSIICAGDGILIESWRNWFLQPHLNVDDIPPTDRQNGIGGVESITISVMQSGTGSLLFSSGWYHVFEDYAYFSGTGWSHAVQCFSKNRCGKKCITSAGMNDPATGGETKYVDLVSNQHNLNKGMVSLADAKAQLTNRGYVMNTKTKNITPIKEYLATVADPAARNLVAGGFTLSAPTGLPQKPWPESERERLREALAILQEDDRALAK